MAGDFKMEFELKGTRYVLNRAAAAMLLASLDGFGDACSDGCKRMRDDLRKALDGVEAVTPANPFDGEEAEVTEEHTLVINIDKGTLNAERSTLNAQVDAPRCLFCGKPGVASGSPVFDMWRCQNAECFRRSAGNFTRVVFEGGVQ